jgi:hypothetical protein
MGNDPKQADRITHGAHCLATEFYGCPIYMERSLWSKMYMVPDSLRSALYVLLSMEVREHPIEAE